MPITRTVQGMIVYEEFDVYPNGWALSHYGYDPSVGSLDTVTKHSGVGAFKTTCDPWPQQPITLKTSFFFKSLVFGSGSGRLDRIWHKTTYIPLYGYRVGFFATDQPWWYQNWLCYTGYETGPHDWRVDSCSIPDGVTSTHACGVNYDPTSTYDAVLDWVDHLVICRGTTVTVTGLTPGQKVEIYRSSDNHLIDTKTCAPAPATSVVLDVSAEDFPEQMYLKVYATDGSTLVETTTSYEICGGDTWNWTANVGTISVVSDVFIIYRSAAAATPKTANITATLLTGAGVPYPNKTVNFSTTLCTVTPSS